MSPRVVVDSSAIVALAVDETPRPGLLKRIFLSRPCAPEIIDLEVLHALRNKTLRGEIPNATARRAIETFVDLPITRVPHRSLLGRVWELRHSITAYDAAYVALAERLHAPVVTFATPSSRAATRTTRRSRSTPRADRPTMRSGPAPREGTPGPKGLLAVTSRGRPGARSPAGR